MKKRRGNVFVMNSVYIVHVRHAVIKLSCFCLFVFGGGILFVSCTRTAREAVAAAMAATVFGLCSLALMVQYWSTDYIFDKNGIRICRKGQVVHRIEWSESETKPSGIGRPVIRTESGPIALDWMTWRELDRIRRRIQHCGPTPKGGAGKIKDPEKEKEPIDPRR